MKRFDLRQIMRDAHRTYKYVGVDYLDMLIMAMIFRIKPTPKRPKAKIGKI